MKRNVFVMGMLLLFFTCMYLTNGDAQVKLSEVNKGQIPSEYLQMTLKTLLNTIRIWDEDEAIRMLDNSKAKILWIDTRPRSLYESGTIKGAVLLAYNKDETLDEGIKNESAILTKASLQAALDKSGADTIAIFCQGPACHRSYNAALRAVNNWGFDVNKVIWFRAGYPNLLKKVQEDPRLLRKMNRYFQGSILTQ